ncbi:hypothetical protein [Halobellus sp. GM3]|uniref:hypothetical protein n=1 Tax=Halobellus sp. GM3 TaxID=3458410 RepID=UPI00403D9D26
MIDPVASAYQRLDDARPFVRPTYNQFEVELLPPYGDPEVHVPGEVGTYVGIGVLASALLERLDEE